MTNVVQFPARTEPEEEDGPRSCDLCVFFLSGPTGEYCRALNEVIMNVREAEDCDLFEAV